MPLDGAASRGGYASLAYARTLAHVGEPFFVAPWGTHVLMRPIPGTGLMDATGPYPLCMLAPWADIPEGLAALRSAGAVSVALVADPLAEAPAFPVRRPFKTHYLAEPGTVASAHHRARIRRGLRHAAVRQVALADVAWAEAWAALYAGLVRRRGIVGVADFPAEAFAALAQVEGVVALAAEGGDGVLGMMLWLRAGSHGYSHLTAVNEQGRRLGAAYALYAAAIETLGCEVLDLGGGAGCMDDGDHGLAAFKRGFASGSAPAYLCGAVLDVQAYAGLGGGAGGFFPAYRAPPGTPREAAE